MTASEPLTLDEEYEMQKSWQEDPDKLTFILIHPDFISPDPRGTISGYGGMIGDVNLYCMPPETRDGGEEEQQPPPLKSAEIEVMIAEESMRGQGLAGEAVRMMMYYAASHLSIQRFIAKISERNQQSRKLFENKLGYELVSRSAVFQEVTLQCLFDPSAVAKESRVQLFKKERFEEEIITTLT